MGSGFIALDVIRSTLSDATTSERHLAGGSCANVLAILAYLGLKTSAVGRIGKDRAGTKLRADLRRCRVDTAFLEEDGPGRTPIVIQETLMDARGRVRHRFLTSCPLCGTSLPRYRPLRVATVPDIASALPRHDVFFFDRVAPSTLELARNSHALGALVVFEPSGIRDEKLFLECLRVSHVLKYSHERLNGVDAFTSQVRPLLEIETKGEDGLRFRMGRSGRVPTWTHLKAIMAESIHDAAGSGDWCTAGFVAQVTANVSPVKQLSNLDTVVGALRFGQGLAALNCSYDGARGLMYAVTRRKTLQGLERLLAAEKPRLPSDSCVSIVKRDARGSIACSDLHHAYT